MQENVKFSRADLRVYLLTGFKLGKAFKPGFEGSQLVKTKRAGGVLIEVDAQGAPQLRDDFVTHMDKTTYGLTIPYSRFEHIFDELDRKEVFTQADEKAAYLRKTWIWWSFQRNHGVTVEAFAERMGVHPRTIYRWVVQLFVHIEDELKKPPKAEVIVFPSSLRQAEMSG